MTGGILPLTDTEVVRTEEGHEFELTACASTAVSSMGYMPQHKKLLVVFKPEPSIVYVYEDVGPALLVGLMAASSKGKFINSEIKPKCRVTKEVVIR